MKTHNKKKTSDPYLILVIHEECPKTQDFWFGEPCIDVDTADKTVKV